MHPDAGAIGVRMIDGAGYFLPESKRGLPNPWRAFCKFSGLCAAFPHSKLFAGYYLGHLDPDKTQEVEILSGAFMLCSKEALTLTQGFDEQFFMYAEDIDLCYRIRQAGFRNYYIADSSIIHFKGESTRRDISYLKQFYGAMSQFIHKHFRSTRSRIFVSVLDFGIFIRLQIMKMLLSFQYRKSANEKKNRSFFIGDNEKPFPASDPWREIVDTEAMANELIFCEGQRLSFQAIIEKMEINQGRYSFKIHAQSSDSYVGSDSRTANGFAAPLDS
jgi:N-acetylglucosaminyl-diphospho-decaprenol L-rhamnosyltransferase